MSNNSWYKKGDYVVLLHTCSRSYPDHWGEEGLPINHVYRLNQDAGQFIFEVEANLLGSKSGWGMTPKLDTNREGVPHFALFCSNLLLRAATPEEIQRYKDNDNLPVKIDEKECIYSNSLDLKAFKDNS